MPATEGSQVVELMAVASDGNKVIVSVTMLSHPNEFVKCSIKTPTSDGSQDEDMIKVESCNE